MKLLVHLELKVVASQALLRAILASTGDINHKDNLGQSSLHSVLSTY
jgi:hypothetical protein